eukprot:jgi/Psemu1/285378/fgenesh1_pg.84_\
MTDEDLELASAISPRMSVCLKASNDDIAALIADIDDEDSSLEDACGTNGTNDTCTTRRSSYSSSSILLTGTTYSILSSSRPATQGATVDDEEGENGNGNKNRRQSNVRFSESVHFRNYLHVSDLTSEERAAAWFCSSEYRTIFRNNMKIIQSIGKRDKEMKKIMSKKKREEQKLKKKKKKHKLNDRLNDGNESCGSCSELDNVLKKNNNRAEHITGTNGDEEKGYSVRGLENETSKKRRKRDKIYLRARYAVLSLQADLDGRMELLQEEFDDQMEQLVGSSKTKKKKKRHFLRRMSLASSSSSQEDGEVEVMSAEETHEMMMDARLKFAEYAQAQYDKMISAIAERYAEICSQHGKDAMERGSQDERTARAIDWIEASREQNLEISSVVAEFLPQKEVVVDTTALSDEKRRPSASSTSETEESVTQASSMKSVDDGGGDNITDDKTKDIANTHHQFRVMKRAKKFLRRLSM